MTDQKLKTKTVWAIYSGGWFYPGFFFQTRKAFLAWNYCESLSTVLGFHECNNRYFSTVFLGYLDALGLSFSFFLFFFFILIQVVFMLHLKTRKSDAIFHGFCTLWSYTYFFVAWSSHSYFSLLKWCIEQLELELSVLPPFIYFWEMFLDYLPSCFNAIHKWFLLVNTHCFKTSTNNSYLHLTDVGRCWQSCGNYFIASGTSAGVSPLSVRIGLTWRKFHQEKLLVIILFL